MIPVAVKAAIFLLGSGGLAWVSRASLRNARLHGFTRFFAWEGILALFCLNVDFWYSDPFSPWQIVSWILLFLSLSLVLAGASALRQKGKPDPARADDGLLGIEKTTELVTTGLYGSIRHPFYASLLWLDWGIFLKHLSWPGLALALAVTWLLVQTARKEEVENTRYFGEKYREYMQRTKMFVPRIY